MKKLIWTLCLVIGMSSLAYADFFCCGDGKTKEECCAAKGKMYCPNDNSCRTRCLGVTPPNCVGGCINPEGVCCKWCPSAEVCKELGKCQKIVDGCYQCIECPIPNPCPVPQCMNGDGVCCDSCPRTCPAGQCLINIDGCYECSTDCGNKDDDVDDDDDDDEITETEGNKCDVPLVDKWQGECCDEGTRPCCPSKEDCACYPTKGNCKCEPPKKVSSEGYCCDKDWVPVTEIECKVDGLCYEPNDGCPICVECEEECTETDGERCGEVCCGANEVCCDEATSLCCPIRCSDEEDTESTEDTEVYSFGEGACCSNCSDTELGDTENTECEIYCCPCLNCGDECDNLTWDTNKCEYCEDGEIKDWCPGETQCCKGTCYDIVCDPCEEFNWETCCCEPVSDPHCDETETEPNGCEPLCDLERCYVCDNTTGNCVFGCPAGYSCCSGGQCRRSCGGSENLCKDVECEDCQECDKKTGKCISVCEEDEICCNNKCKEKPTPDESKCQKLSDNGCEIVSECSGEEVCCSGKCTTPLTCDSEQCMGLSADKCFCESKKTIIGTGRCCDEGTTECCSLTDVCKCVPFPDCGGVSGEGTGESGSCGENYRYEKPAISERENFCGSDNQGNKTVAGRYDWMSRNIETSSDTTTYIMATIGEKYGAPVYWNSSRKLTTKNPAIGYTVPQICGGGNLEYTSAQAQSILACCPANEYVGCRGGLSSEAVCCKNFAKLPEGQTISCGDNLIENSQYVCCDTGGTEAVAIKKEGSEEVIGYLCCAEGEKASLVNGGEENEHICCPEGALAYNNDEIDGLAGDKCCTDGTVVSATYTADGKEITRYECCKEGETAFIDGVKGKPYPTVECCSVGRKPVSDKVSGLQGCCEEDATPFIFKEDDTRLSCCEKGKEPKELREGDNVYRMCCNADEGVVRVEEGAIFASFLCCHSEKSIYEIPSGATQESMTKACCPKDTPYPKNAQYIKDKDWERYYQMCCKNESDKALEVKGGAKDVSYPDFIEGGTFSISVPEYICCEEGYQTAYWDGESSKCCKGEAFATGFKDGNGREIYDCCAENESKVWVKMDEQANPDLSLGYAHRCCGKYTDAGGQEKEKVGYWNGETLECCEEEKAIFVKGLSPKGKDGYSYGCCFNGQTRKNGVEGEHQLYDCCSGATTENATHKIVSVVGSKYGEGKEEACCEIAKYGENPTAYWNGTEVKCCKGEVYHNGQTYECCASDTHVKKTVINKDTGMSNEYEVCCEKSIYGEEAVAFWNGKEAKCCAGYEYTYVTAQDGSTTTQECCDPKTHKKVEEVKGIPAGKESLDACCKVADYGENPAAYWNGTEVKCCVSSENIYEKDGDNGTKVYDCCNGEFCGTTCCENGCDATGKACCEVSCGEGENKWCCPKENTCGETKGQCCAQGYEWAEFVTKFNFESRTFNENLTLNATRGSANKCCTNGGTWTVTGYIMALHGETNVCEYIYDLENNPNITEEEVWSAWGTLKCRDEYYGCGGPGSCAENETWKIATWSGPYSSSEDKYYSDGAFYACVRNDAEEYTDDPHYYCADWRDGECYFRF